MSYVARAHTRVCAHTQGLPGDCGQTRTPVTPPSARPTQPQGISAVSALQLCGFWLPELTHARTHPPPPHHPHMESTAHAHRTRSLRGLPGAPAPGSCWSSLQPLSSQEVWPGAPNARHAQEVLRAGVRMKSSTLAAV